MRFPSTFSSRFLMAAVALAGASGLRAQTLNFGVLAGSPPSAGSEDGSGAGGLRFNSPESTAVDSGGNLFIADFQNNTIRKVTPAGTVTTFAGLAGAPGSMDGTGGAARFNGPIGLEIDSLSNLYVTDSGNNTIRKISPAGVVTTLAGLAGAVGSADGTGAAARFNFPYALAWDGGSFYVADAGNCTIRQVGMTGVVTTPVGVAGNCAWQDGTGNGALFNFPTDLVWDAPSSTLYVTEGGNALVRKIAPGGVVTTFAGNTVGACTNADGALNVGDLCFPNNITRDSLGNFYVTDEATHNIRKITTGGTISTFAGPNQALCPVGPNGPLCPTGSVDGSGTGARFNAPEGIAFDAANNLLWVTDYQSNDLRKIAVVGAGVTRVAGTPASVGAGDGTGTGAQFDQPFGITRTGTNYYAVDINTHTVRQITSGGVTSPIAGIPYTAGYAEGPGASAAFNSPRGITANSGGTLLYVADAGNHRVRTIDPVGATHTVATLAGISAGGNCDGAAGTGRMRQPRAVAFSSGAVYVADVKNNNIRKIDGAGNLTTFAGAGSAVCPGAAAPAGSADGTGAAASFNTPTGIAVDGAGNVYVSDAGNQTIRMITPPGAVTTVAGSPGLPGSADGIGAAARFRGPGGLSFDAGGKLLIADQGNHTLRRYDPATGAVTTIAGTAGRTGSGPGTGPFANFATPRQVITDASGNYVVSDGGNHAIRISALTGLADLATIDAPYGPVGTARQLSTNPNTAATWAWKQLRQPTGGAAALSSAAIRNPTFTPDITDYYVFQVTATNGANSATTEVALRSRLNPVILQDLVHQPTIARIGDVALLHVQDLPASPALFFSNGTSPTVAATIIGVDTDRGIVAARVPATAASGNIRLTSAGTDALPYYYRIGAGTVTTGPDQVSGTVTRASDAAPVANALVLLLPGGGGNNNCGGGGGDVRDAALTNGSGAYVLHGDPGSAQVVAFSPFSSGTATGSVSVTLSGTPQVAPLALAAGTTVSGTVTDATSGRPLAGASINFECKSCSFGFEVGLIDANGNFSFHLLPGAANDERIELHAPYKTALTYYQNNFTVGAGPTQSLGTIPLAQGIAISGTVTRVSDGTQISGADVSAQPQLGGNDVDRTQSAGDGGYLLTVPPNQSYSLQEQTNSTAPFVDANNVPLAVTTQPQLQNFPLLDAGYITGIVTDSGTGLPISGLSLQARLATNLTNSVGYASTCSDGSYTLRVAPGGANAVVVSTQNNSCSGCNPPPPPPYADLTYKSGGNTWFYCEGTPLTLAATGSTISGINFSTPRSATVTGSFLTQSSNCTTTDAGVNQNQVTLDDGAVHACGLGDTYNNSPPPAGTYQINNLPPSSMFTGGIRSCFSGGGTYSPQCSYKKLAPAYDPITVAANGSAAANFCLGNLPTAALGNNFRLAKSGGNINFTWNASADLYHDHYRIYQSATAKPVTPPGSFPGDPFPPGNYTDIFSGTTSSQPAGSGSFFFLVVDTGISGSIGPSGSYGY